MKEKVYAYGGSRVESIISIDVMCNVTLEEYI